MGVSENLCSFLKEVKPLVLYSVEHGIAMEPMMWKWASPRADLRYTELFYIPEVHQCSSRFVTVFLGTLSCSIKKIEAPYVFDWENGIALHAMQGNRSSFPSEVDVSYFVELQQEPGVYTRVTAAIAMRNSSFFTEVRTPA